ncbi:hypothetical protein JYQ62_34240 [Nostoc sp. UHCC 0702]|nr:hypothetical protein JYQ62_34240 [Nostoc sp. UHCC 0702]
MTINVSLIAEVALLILTKREMAILMIVIGWGDRLRLTLSIGSHGLQEVLSKNTEPG